MRDRRAFGEIAQEYVLCMLVPWRKHVVAGAAQNRLVIHADRRPLRRHTACVGAKLWNAGVVAQRSEEPLGNNMRFDRPLLSTAETAEHPCYPVLLALR